MTRSVVPPSSSRCSLWCVCSLRPLFLPVWVSCEGCTALCLRSRYEDNGHWWGTIDHRRHATTHSEQDNLLIDTAMAVYCCVKCPTEQVRGCQTHWVVARARKGKRRQYFPLFAATPLLIDQATHTTTAGEEHTSRRSTTTADHTATRTSSTLTVAEEGTQQAERSHCAKA